VSNSKATILVVDDDEKTRKMMEAMLTPQGYRVILAKDGKESVDAAARKKPDFILMDMMMPVMDGFAACHEIKANPATRGIPVFILTAADAMGNQQMAQEIWGADGYLTKPVDLKELLNTINRVLDKKK
jgi:putative two-component system response regulator